MGSFSCQRDQKDGSEQFRERQQAILERDSEPEKELEETETMPEAPASEAQPAQEPSVAEPTKPTLTKPSTTTGDKVVGVKDGDTIVLLQNGEEVTVRLYGVDTPEKNQAYGQKAKQFTSNLVFGKQVQLIVKNKDRYGRTVGTIRLPDGRSLNEELVKEGYAWHYKAYSKDVNLANAEADARRFKRGLWADPNPVAPWDFRKNKTTKKVVDNSNAPIPAGATKRMVYLCKGNSTVYYVDKDCSALKRCKAGILTVTEAVAIREYNRRPDKVCAN